MRMTTTGSFLAILIGTVFTGLSLARDLPADATLGSLRLNYDILRSEAMKPVTELDTLYSTNLEKLKAGAQTAGRLEEVLAAKGEKEQFTKTETAEIAETFPDLRRLQSIYRQERARRLVTYSEKEKPIQQQFLQDLETLKTRLTQQGKLDDAVAVNETMASLTNQATSSPAPPLLASARNGTETIDSSFPGGKLFAIGKVGLLPGVEIDLSPAEGITDFVDVTGNQSSWAALRKDGTAIGWHLKTGPYTRPGIRKLVGNLKFDGDHLGITTKGKLINLANGTEIVDADNVVDAVKESSHGLALLDDGSVRTWGEIYEGPVGSSQPFPKPPAEKLQDVSKIAASRYNAWVVKKNGELTGWGSRNIHDSLSTDFRGLTEIWGHVWGFFAETKRGGLLEFSIYNPTGSTEVKETPKVIRPGDEVVVQLLKNRWKILYIPHPGGELHNETTALEKLDENDLPYFYLKNNNDKPSTSYLLWLSADDPG